MVVWEARECEQPRRVVTGGPWRLTRTGITAVADVGEVFPVEAAVRMEAATADGPQAVLLVPDELGGLVDHGGEPLAVGTHVLRQRIGVSFERLQIWISPDDEARVTAYDPAVHGNPAYCARTRVRLQTGEPVVVCPGIARQPCGLIFKEVAWELRIACHGCGRPRRPSHGSRIFRKDRWHDFVQFTRGT